MVGVHTCQCPTVTHRWYVVVYLGVQLYILHVTLLVRSLEQRVSEGEGEEREEEREEEMAVQHVGRCRTP